MVRLKTLFRALLDAPDRGIRQSEREREIERERGGGRDKETWGEREIPVTVVGRRGIREREGMRANESVIVICIYR